MTNLKNYLNDGADYQAQSVLAYLRTHLIIEESGNDKFKKYYPMIKAGRWENCREQGYVLTMNKQRNGERLNIAFFEHRNSDDLCALSWHQNTTNTPTIDTADFKNECYSDKYDVSFRVAYMEIIKMCEWIIKQFSEEWQSNDSIKWKLKDNEKVKLPSLDDLSNLDGLVGKKWFFRTTTYHMVGRVIKRIGDFIQLENALWVADSGRFTNAIKEGKLNEVEPVGLCFINLDSVTDFFPWSHDLPKDQK